MTMDEPQAQSLKSGDAPRGITRGRGTGAPATTISRALSKSSSSKSWEPFEDGSKFGALTILNCVERAEMRANTWYSVLWSCCNRYAEVRHTTLVARIKTNPEKCPLCREYERRRAKPEPLRVVIANGHIWPMLGRMGPRNGEPGRRERLENTSEGEL